MVVIRKTVISFLFKACYKLSFKRLLLVVIEKNDIGFNWKDYNWLSLERLAGCHWKNVIGCHWKNFYCLLKDCYWFSLVGI